MTVNFSQAFELVGAGMLAAAALFIWFAGSIGQRDEHEPDSAGGCMLALLVFAIMLGCLFLLWLALR